MQPSEETCRDPILSIRNTHGWWAGGLVVEALSSLSAEHAGEMLEQPGRGFRGFHLHCHQC